MRWISFRIWPALGYCIQYTHGSCRVLDRQRVQYTSMSVDSRGHQLDCQLCRLPLQFGGGGRQWEGHKERRIPTRGRETSLTCLDKWRTRQVGNARCTIQYGVGCERWVGYQVCSRRPIWFVCQLASIECQTMWRYGSPFVVQGHVYSSWLTSSFRCLRVDGLRPTLLFVFLPPPLTPPHCNANDIPQPNDPRHRTQVDFKSW